LEVILPFFTDFSGLNSRMDDFSTIEDIVDVVGRFGSFKLDSI